MITEGPAFKTLTPSLIGSTITLQSDKDKVKFKVTGRLIGFHAEGWATRSHSGEAFVTGFTMTANLDLGGADCEIPVTSDTTLEVHP